ncbi:hypothetical protein L3X38_043153 [Prunus dulcis]|uniref:Uncharacterized protein n=1 Tax=Prunus dulcis TaxID=3755 RepID=A0AAD4UXX3_PRUDU|nr:hypothetical protein L3X38_043153 [Prunus dulcis]
MASSGIPSTGIGSGSFWTAKQNKDFGNALAVFDKDTANRWDNVAKDIGEKTQRKSRSIMSLLLKISCLLSLDKYPSRIRGKKNKVKECIS